MAEQTPPAVWWSPSVRHGGGLIWEHPHHGGIHDVRDVPMGVGIELPADAVRLVPDDIAAEALDANERMGDALVQIGMRLGLPRPTAQVRWGAAEILARIDEVTAAEGLFRALAAGRREYTDRLDPADPRQAEHRDDLLAEAATWDLAARIAAGDYGPLYDLLPSWRWTDAMHQRVLSSTSGETTTADVEVLGRRTTADELPVPPDVLISATRYALGRATYIVGETADLLVRHADRLPGQVLSVLVRDIGRAITAAPGMECDDRAWRAALDTLRAALARRTEETQCRG